MALVLRAPAKINLALEVGPRRADGYHGVRTVLQAMSLCDVVTVEAADRLEVTCDDPEVPAGENLARRAADALRAALGPPGTAGASIHLAKAIPVAAGLGGASSDAAATLRALARLWGARLSFERLQELAAGLGSDVPFFLTGGTALGEGRGERCRPLPPLPGCVLVVACPPRRVSTAEVYRRWDHRPAGRIPEGRGVDAVVRALGRGDLPGVARALWNDLRAVTEEMAPEVAEIRAVLEDSGALGAEMSGSGPSTFGLFTSAEAAGAAAEKVRAMGYRAFLCRPLGAWPLYPGSGEEEGEGGEDSGGRTGAGGGGQQGTPPPSE